MTDRPEYITDALLAACRTELAAMALPAESRSLYPALYAAAERAANACGERYSYAVCAVFHLVADAAGVKYGSQYMSHAIHRRHESGELAVKLKALTPEAEGVR